MAARKLWLLQRTESGGYDTYVAFVVCAADAVAARGIPFTHETTSGGAPASAETWPAEPDAVTVRYLGNAAAGVEIGVVLDHFNAG